MLEPIPWQLATISAIRQETPTVKTFRFELPSLVRHRAGHHYDVRLRAPDGYVAQRSYSVASAPEDDGELELTIELVTDGEVSGHLHANAVVGDRIELRGPIGGYFVWETAKGGPLLLVGGGSGVVPLMSMLRHRRSAGSKISARLLYSARSADDLIFRDELDAMALDSPEFAVTYTLTRRQPRDWAGHRRRIDPAMLSEVAHTLGPHPLTYVCGPTPMVEAAANGLVDIGFGPDRIRTERFGPTGS